MSRKCYTEIKIAYNPKVIIKNHVFKRKKEKQICEKWGLILTNLGR